MNSDQDSPRSKPGGLPGEPTWVRVRGQGKRRSRSLPGADLLLAGPDRTSELVALPAQRHPQAEEGSRVRPVDGALALEL